MQATNEAAQQAAYRLAARELNQGYQFKALHCYANDKGEALFWRIRLGHPQNGEKWIRPMHHDGKDFRMGEPAFTQGKPLYNLPALAQQDGQTVIIVEGELCVDTLRTIGVLATTSGAADSAALADWRILSGRQVVIWPDNDDAGMRYAQQVGTLLQDLACHIRVIDIAALHLPAKGDVVNWWYLHPQATPQHIASLPTLEFSRKGDISKSTAKLSASTNHLPTWGQAGKIEDELLPVPAFDSNNLLPEVLRKWVQDEAERISCPISFVAVSGLVALGAVIGANCAIKPKNKDSWCVVPNLWGAIIGPPSSAKTPAISAAFVPLKALEDTACAYFQRQLAEYEVVQIVQDAQQAAIVASIKTNAKKETKPKSSKPQKAHAAESGEVQTEEENKQESIAELSAQLKNHRGQEAARPILKRFTTNDSTIEKLGELLRDNPAGLLVTRDEVTGLLSTWDKEGREADRAFYLEA